VSTTVEGISVEDSWYHAAPRLVAVVPRGDTIGVLVDPPTPQPAHPAYLPISIVVAR
jgi:hypothetical protein